MNRVSNIDRPLDNFVELDRLTLKQLKITKRIMEEELRLGNVKLSWVAFMRYLALFREFWREQKHVPIYLQRFITTTNALISKVSYMCANYETAINDNKFMTEFEPMFQRVSHHWVDAQEVFEEMIITEDNDSTVHYKYASPKYVAWVIDIATSLVVTRGDHQVGESNLRDELYRNYAHFSNKYYELYPKCYVN